MAGAGNRREEYSASVLGAKMRDLAMAWKRQDITRRISVLHFTVI